MFEHVDESRDQTDFFHTDCEYAGGNDEADDRTVALAHTLKECFNQFVRVLQADQSNVDHTDNHRSYYVQTALGEPDGADDEEDHRNDRSDRL